MTVLRHRLVPRVELTSTIAYRSSSHLGGSANAIAGIDAAPTTVMPMSSLLYAVSLAVHQPILSAIGCYDLGNDINLKNLGGLIVVQIIQITLYCQSLPFIYPVGCLIQVGQRQGERGTLSTGDRAPSIALRTPESSL